MLTGHTNGHFPDTSYLLYVFANICIASSVAGNEKALERERGSHDEKKGNNKILYIIY